MVFDPGTTKFEGNNPGILYCGLSRASTLGENINHSSFYLHGTNATMQRLTNVKFKQNRPNELYIKVAQRQDWISYLNKRQRATMLEKTIHERENILKWMRQENKVCEKDLDGAISYFNSLNSIRRKECSSKQMKSSK